MLSDSEGHGSDWNQVFLRKPAADSSKRVCGLVVFELKDLSLPKEVQSHLP